MVQEKFGLNFPFLHMASCCYTAFEALPLIMKALYHCLWRALECALNSSLRGDARALVLSPSFSPSLPLLLLLTLSRR